MSGDVLVGNIWAWRNVRAKFAPYAAIPLRLVVGYDFLAHGLAKWQRGPEAFASILHAMGVPSPQLMAWLTIATEILSGIAFLIGGFVSLVSIPSIILLAVASHGGRLWATPYASHGATFQFVVPAWKGQRP